MLLNRSVRFGTSRWLALQAIYTCSYLVTRCKAAIRMRLNGFRSQISADDRSHCECLLPENVLSASKTTTFINDLWIIRVIDECYVQIRYPGHGQAITSHSICWMSYLSLRLIPDSDMTLLICEANKRIPCESDICHMWIFVDLRDCIQMVSSETVTRRQSDYWFSLPCFQCNWIPPEWHARKYECWNWCPYHIIAFWYNHI